MGSIAHPSKHPPQQINQIRIKRYQPFDSHTVCIYKNNSQKIQKKKTGTGFENLHIRTASVQSVASIDDTAPFYCMRTEKDSIQHKSWNQKKGKGNQFKERFMVYPVISYK